MSNTKRSGPALTRSTITCLFRIQSGIDTSTKSIGMTTTNEMFSHLDEAPVMEDLLMGILWLQYWQEEQPGLGWRLQGCWPREGLGWSLPSETLRWGSK